MSSSSDSHRSSIRSDDIKEFLEDGRIRQDTLESISTKKKSFDTDASLRAMENLPMLDRDKQEYVNIHRKQDLTSKRKLRMARRERERKRRETNSPPSSLDGGDVRIRVIGKSSSRSTIGMFSYFFTYVYKLYLF